MADPAKTPAAPAEDVSDAAERAARITPRALVIGMFFTVLFAFSTAYMENRLNQFLTSDQIAVMPYVLVFLSVVIVNPLLGLVSWLLRGLKRVARLLRPLSMAEILVIFIMGSVSAGLSTFGMVSQLLPLSGSFYNEHWNTDQSQWDLHVAPFLNDAYFVSEPGVQKAAVEYRRRYLALERLNEPYRMANRLQQQTAVLQTETERLEALLAEAAAHPDDITRQDSVSAAGKALDRRRLAVETLQTDWQAMRVRYAAPEVADTISTYPAMIAAAEQETAEAKAALEALEAEAFKKVELFRRGLPEEMRAFPGAVKIKGEDFPTYMGRVRQFWMGIEARREVAAALEAAKAGGGLQQERIDVALAKLREVSADAELNAAIADIDAQWNTANQQSLEFTAARKDAVLEGEMASSLPEIREANEKQRDLGKKIAELESQKKDLVAKKTALLAQIGSVKRVQAMITDLEALRGSELSGVELADVLAPLHARFSTFDASWRRFLIGEVPYSAWIRPLFNWGLLIGLTYVALMAFNVLIYRQWAYNERLIYPLAKLPEMMAGARGDGTDDGSSTSWLPGLYRNGFFWAGFAIAALYMGWNVFVKSGSVPELNPLPIKFRLDTYLGGKLPSLGGDLVQFHIMFVMIGLAFLIPANISFSLWFFHVLMFAQTMILVSLGQGKNIGSFPSEWYYTLNFASAEGGGALIVFSTVTLWKCRKYLFSCFMPKAVEALETAERKELRIASATFLISSLGIVCVITFGMGANFWWTLFSLFVVLTITVGLVRAVTEGGILGFQAWVSPFHLMRSGVGMDKSWSGAAQVVPLFVYYAVLFLDIKTFIAPAMANAIKIRDDLKMRRLRFHIAIALCIALAAITAVVMHLMLSYDKGADQMQGWFYSSFPRGFYAKAAAMVKDGPVDPSGPVVSWLPVTESGMWILFGVFVMAALIWGRQHLFWLPHPIGFIMLVNPRMKVYWFSILIGWFCKRLITKYGNKDTYDRVRGLFVGLIVGELLVIFVSTMLSILLEKNMGVNLNRY